MPLVAQADSITRPVLHPNDGRFASALIAEMLARTGKDLGQGESPYDQAEIFQFCSVVLSWQLVREDPAQIGRCPLSIALYTLRDEPGTVHLVYRAPGDGSPGLRQAGATSAVLDLRGIADGTPDQGIAAARLFSGPIVVPITLEELASEFGVSRERVRQIEVRAFEKVQKAVKSRMAAMEQPAEAPAIAAH